ncbi:hypothetical protein HU200_059228 [Digitaria exilis]|uniref:Ubiquitin-like domain-containing protein n=1 Tax=Digitaria exilis TaxID=1010633 RepID=A0A835AGZ4_9POAL|nr:hypothetical protein HU200_059228 [Digitaria exilis]
MLHRSDGCDVAVVEHCRGAIRNEPAGRGGWKLLDATRKSSWDGCWLPAYTRQGRRRRRVVRIASLEPTELSGTPASWFEDERRAWSIRHHTAVSRRRRARGLPEKGWATDGPDWTPPTRQNRKERFVSPAIAPLQRARADRDADAPLCWIGRRGRSPPPPPHRPTRGADPRSDAGRREGMDVTFATARGREFTVEVWYFATVREVKEAVEKAEGVPADSQRLFLAGRELDDDAREAYHYGVLQGSRLLLLLPDDPAPPPPSSPATTPAAVRVAVTAPAIGRCVALDLRATDTVARLKEILQDRTDGALPAARSAVFHGKAEMEDGRALADYDPTPAADGTMMMMEVCVIVRHPPASAPAAVAGGGNGGGARTMSQQQPQQQRIAVEVKFGAKAVAMEVGAMDVVRDLRKEVERLRLPVHDGGGGGGGGYFFVYKQNIMDEDRTMRWHDVKNGDTIEIFNGTVTGGGA